MKKGLLIVFGIIVFLTGCKESPKDDIVANKNEDRLEQAVSEEADNVEDDVAPKKTDSFENATKDLKITVDANVISMNLPMPVLRVKPRDITSEDLKLWGEVLFEGREVYDPASPKTKKELEQEILEWEQWKQELSEQYTGEELQNMTTYYEETIARLEDAYTDAPDNASREETDYAFHPYEYYAELESGFSSDDKEAKDMKFEAVTTSKEGRWWEILATNRNETDYSMHALSWYACFDNENIKIPYQKCSREEAVAMAEEIKNKLGYDEWQMYSEFESDDGESCVHQISFSRYYEGVPSIGGLSVDLQSKDLYAANLYYETLQVKVTNGEITSVDLESPMDILEVENKNVKTMSFDEVYECFKNQMQSQYSKSTYLENGYFEDDTAYQEGTISIRITNIEEGMIRIKIKDSTDEYRMVPAWIFRGNCMFDGEIIEENMAYVVINAIDGSVINPTLGY